MKNKVDFKKILDGLKELHLGYLTTYRASIQPSRYEAHKHIYSSLNDENIRENLLEHVGHLPVTATFLYPFLEDTEVDLGKVLIMLAIHDIGETKLGDVMFLQKTKQEQKTENNVALKMLHPIYHEAYKDIEEQISKNGKFAKSVDKIVGDILELNLEPEITLERYRVQANLKPDEIIPVKRQKKMPLMEWNLFLREFYNFVLEEQSMHLTGNR